ncbi:hypothetical protein M378DRAFT_292139 [Amanita muscaria Koide BX008]|uniref:Uncharacterized protein n=1 Tax=Amanita muscaria (strain Koide BX008) TaxID=946122 RepID=A0A0C2SXI7_AMAMK|nr:hypothetical protein M378DRAFT_292139 [Amanita muscaria Koide BX008]
MIRATFNNSLLRPTTTTTATKVVNSNSCKTNTTRGTDLRHTNSRYYTGESPDVSNTVALMFTMLVPVEEEIES